MSEPKASVDPLVRLARRALKAERARLALLEQAAQRVIQALRASQVPQE